MPGVTNCHLLLASQQVYRVSEKQNNPDSIKHKLKSLIELQKNNYTEIAVQKPKAEGGSGESGLAAIALSSNDNSGTIIVSFRGTKTWSDVGSDVSIMRSGLAENQQLQDAIKFYDDIKSEYPEKNIILTGHSLGGHIATYVGVMAHLNDGDSCPVVAVRTFNTAPFSQNTTKNLDTDNKLDKKIENKFIHIRLNSDMISSKNDKSCYGNIFSFCSRIRNPISAHMLWAMNENLPENFKNLQVSSDPKDVLKENLLGMLYSYESRVKGQFFSTSRLGTKNYGVLMELYKNIQEAIDNNDRLEGIIALCTDSSKKLHGSQSRKILQQFGDLINEQLGIKNNTEEKNNNSATFGTST